jgi:hypothetical protein
VDLETNLRLVLEFVWTFLREVDGGARLAAVTGAFITLLNEPGAVKVYQPTTSDKFAGTAGDIEIYSQNALVSAYECKHRPLTLEDVRHGIAKAREKACPEYCFVIAVGMAEGQEEDIREAIRDALTSIDVSVLGISEAMQPWAVALNPARRSRFGELVSSILRNAMRRHDVANVAAELWNSLGE